MPIETAGTVLCPACKKAFRWKPELAGKRGKCKCGGTVQFPVAPPGAADDLLDLMPLPVAPKPAAPTPQPTAASTARMRACSGCSAPLIDGAVLCTRCGLNQRTGKRMGTSVSKENPALKQALLIGGIIVGVVGLLALFVTFAPEAAASTAHVLMIVGVVIALIGLWWATWVATSDNLALRLACRYLPFVGILVVLTRCATSWDEMKVPIAVLLGGAVLAGGSFGMQLYLAMQHVPPVPMGG